MAEIKSESTTVSLSEDQIKALSDAELDSLLKKKLAENKSAVIKVTQPETYDSAGIKAAFSPAAVASDVASTLGGIYDRAAGAPVRKGIGTAMDTGSIASGFKAAYGQFGKDPDLAPTTNEILIKGGVPEGARLSKSAPILFKDEDSRGGQSPLLDIPGVGSIPDFRPTAGGSFDPSGRDALGLVGDAALDITNVVPLTMMAKGALQSTKLGAKMVNAPIKYIAPPIGAAIEGAGKGIANLGKTLSTIINPRIAADYKDAVMIASKYGIPTENLSASIKYGENSFISKMEKTRAEGPTGQARLAAHQKGIDSIRDATDGYIVENIGRGNQPLSPQDAGEVIRDAYNRRLDELFDGDLVTYTSVGEKLNNPTLNGDARERILELIDRKREMATDRLTSGATKKVQEEARFTLDQLERIQPIVQGGQFDHIVKAMRDVGDGAFKSFMDIGWDEKTSRDIYGALREGILETVGSAPGGKQVRAALEENNKNLSKFFKDNALVERIIKNPANGGEQIFRHIIESGDSKKLTALKNIIGGDENAMGVVKSSWLDSLKTEDKDLRFSFARLGAKLRNDNRARTVVQNLFDTKEMQELGELISLGEAYGPPIQNFSGTDISRRFGNLPMEIAKEGSDEGLLAYMKNRAEKSRPEVRRGAVNRFGPGLNAVSGGDAGGAINRKILEIASQYGRELIPSPGSLANKSLRTYSVQEKNSDSGINRRFKKIRDNK